jgi:hypothetical protein
VRKNISHNMLVQRAGTVNAVVFPVIVGRRILTDMILEGQMNGSDVCFICRRTDSEENLSAWFVGNQRLLVHLECWMAWYEQRTPRGRAPRRDSNAPREDESDQAS